MKTITISLFHAQYQLIGKCVRFCCCCCCCCCGHRPVVVIIIIVVEYYGLLGCNTLWFDKEVIWFQRYLLFSPLKQNNVTPCSLAENSQRFRGLSCFHLQGRQVFYQIILCHISENPYLDR